MSNSYKRTPIFPHTGSKSAKWYKKVWHGKLRTRVRNLIAHQDFDNAQFDLPYNDWDDPRDGKQYHTNFYPKGGYGVQYPHSRWDRMTKDLADSLYEKAMRK